MGVSKIRKQLLKIIDEIKINKGLVIYTLIDKKLRKLLERGCQKIGVPIVPVLDPVVAAIEIIFIMIWLWMSQEDNTACHLAI